MVCTTGQQALRLHPGRRISFRRWSAGIDAEKDTSENQVEKNLSPVQRNPALVRNEDAAVGTPYVIAQSCERKSISLLGLRV